MWGLRWSLASLVLANSALCLAAGGSDPAPSRKFPVRVVTPDGEAVTGVQVRCAQPELSGPSSPSEDPPAVSAECREVLCDAPGYLAGSVEVPGAEDGPITCVLEPALRLSITALPAPGHEGLSVEAAPVGGGESKAASFERSAGRAARGGHEGGLVAEVGELRPGEYRLTVRSEARAWQCSARTGPFEAGRVELVAGWRPPAALDGLVVKADGEPRAGLPVTAHEGGARAGTAADGEAAPVGGWRCGPESGSAETISDLEGRFSLPVDPGRKTLVVAGSWEDPGGMAAAVVVKPPKEPLTLIPRRPARMVAALRHEDGAPAGCRAELRVEDTRATWLTEVLGGSLEAECDEDGQVELGPFPVSPGSARFFPEQGLPLIERLEAPAPDETVDLGLLTVPRGESVAVTVVDDTSAPVEDAEVTVRGRSAIVLHVSGETDEEGRVTLSGLPKGSRLRLEVSAEGFLAARRDDLTKEDFPYRISVSRGAGLAGRVVDRRGEPIPRAKVRVRTPDRPTVAVEAADAQGRFDIDDAPAGMLQLTAEAPGYRLLEPVSVEAEAGEWAEGLVLRMEAEPRLRGRVVDASGQPVHRAEVLLIDRWALDSLDASRAHSSARTDARGRFSLSPADTSHVILVARAPGHGPAVERAPLSHRDAPVELTLPRAAAARVHLPEDTRGQATVKLVDGSGVGHSRRIAVTGPENSPSVRFRDLSPGQARAQLVPGPATSAQLEADVKTEIWLEAGARISGRVLHQGRPVPRAVVNAARYQGERIRFGQLRYSDQNGRFRFEGLERGRYLIVAETEHGRAEQPLELAAGQRRDVVLEVERISLRLLVHDADSDAPLAGAAARLRWAGFEGEPSLHGVVAFPRDDLGFDMVVNNFSGDAETTGSSGIALLTVPRKGEFLLNVSRDGYEAISREVELARGQTNLEVALERDRGAALRIELVTEPPGRAGSVLVFGENGQHHAYTSSPARFEDIAPGTYEVVFFVEGYGAGHRRVTVGATGETSVRVEARRGGTLIVPVDGAEAPRPSVRDAKGVDWSLWLARMSVPGQEIVRMAERPGVGPAWIFPGLPPGTYTVQLGDETRQPVPLEPGGVTTAW